MAASPRRSSPLIRCLQSCAEEAAVERFDRAISLMVLGPIAPVALMLTGWWGSLGLLGDGPWIPYGALGGIALGLVLDATFLRRWVGSLLTLRMPALLGVAVFYSVMVYGFFMGLPVANVLVGVAGGYVAGRRATLFAESPEQARRETRSIAAIATGILFLLCCATAWMALSEPTIATELRGMLALPFTPTSTMIYALILVGGPALVAAEYGATLATARWAARR
jgi:hypothetical protein